MDAQALLEFLIAASNAGVDLRQQEVVIRHTTYDGLGQSEEHEIYPYVSELNDNSLILR